MTDSDQETEEQRITALSAWTYGRELRVALRQCYTHTRCWRCQLRVLADVVADEVPARLTPRRLIIYGLSGLGMVSRHRTTHSRTLGVCLDTEMLPFVEWLNENVCPTFYSCQGVDEDSSIPYIVVPVTAWPSLFVWLTSGRSRQPALRLARATDSEDPMLSNQDAANLLQSMDDVDALVQTLSETVAVYFKLRPRELAALTKEGS